MSGSDRKRQKKLESARKKRELLKKETRKREAQFQGKSLLRIAQAAPFGPCWISASIDELDNELTVPIITAVVTRRVRGLLLPEIVLVDRTCLGVKNAMLLPLQTAADLLEHLDALVIRGEELRPCEPLEVQSVVFHALDYARSLGFFAHEDFESALFEPRPEALLATPLATPARPVFISGPNDDVQQILGHLDERVGRDNYVFFAGDFDLNSLDEDEDYEDEDYEDDSVDDALETTGETVDQ